METVFFVHGNPPINKIKESVKESTQIVALDIQTSLSLTAAGIEHKTPDSYSLPDSNIRSMDFLKEWSCRPLAEGKNIKELLAYDTFSFWWCMEQWIYYSFMYRDPLKKIIESIDAVNTILKKEKPKTVVYMDDKALFSKVIPMLASRANMDARSIVHNQPLKERIKESIRPWGIKQFLKAHTKARKAMWRLQKATAKYSPISKDGKKILAVCSYQWKTVEHPALTDAMIGDPYVTPIVEQLKDDDVTYVDITQREYHGFGALKNKAHSIQKHVLLEQYLSGKDIREAKKALKHLQNVANFIESSIDFQRSWDFEGINIWSLIAPQFRCYFTNRLEGHLIDFVCVRALLAHERPNLTIYPCEGGDLAYIFFKLCKDAGIPCIGIQHGTMAYSPLTVHDKTELCSDGPECLPRPTSLLVYGSYYQDFLVKNGNYPKKDTQVIGNLRYDHFVDAKKLSKKDMASKYGFNTGKPIIMYLTQITPIPQESVEISRAVYKAAKELDLPMIVKQHPGEPGDAIYHELSREFGIKPFIIKHASTLELLKASDVLIGAESTLDYEAMILDIPVIVVNFSGKKDTLPFVKDGAALGVYSPKDTLNALKKSLFDSKTRARLIKGMRRLVEAHCYKTDGKAADRAVSAINKLLKRK